jgi:hypothetical protein
MKKTSTLQQRLKAYSAFAGAVAATAGASDANAQIIYTDVTPDATVDMTTTTYNLDLDNNGTVDFVFGFYAGVYNYGTMSFPYNLTYVYTASATTNKVDTLGSASDDFPIVHNSGDAIAPTNGWSGSGAWLLGYAFTSLPYSSGNWLGQTDKYLAVEFAIGTNIHYGWVRLDHAADASSITIKDYAYESMPMLPITAGAMPITTGIQTLDANTKVYAYNKTVNVDLGTAQDAVISVVDMTGREVAATSLAAGFTTIDLRNEAEGIYCVNVRTAEGTKVVKVSIR